MVWHEIVLSNKTLRRLQSCRALVRVGVGYDNIDCECAGELGIPVVNIPDYGTNDVAVHALTLVLALARKLSVYAGAVRVNPVSNWKHDIAGRIWRLDGTTLGIIGLGRIGTAVALRAKAFGIRVAFYDPYLDDGYDKTYQVQRIESLEELLQISDFLSIHAPLNEETSETINKDSLAHCKADMILINTARGKIVSLDAVFGALVEGRLHAFAADVLDPEPPSSEHPLIEAYSNREAWLDGRLLLTPHAAFYTEESRHEMRKKAAGQMLRAVRGRPLRNCVNERFLKQPRTPIAKMDYR